MSTPKADLLTPEEYLAIERKAETKSEYINGRMVAMSGASERHNIIGLNVAAELRSRMRGRPCRVYHAGMRVKVSRTGMYTYPDIVALCGEPRLEDDHLDTLLNPTVIVEVLSDSTEAYDRGKKFGHYRQIDTLQEYVLVSQDEMDVVHYLRENDRWTFSEMSNPTDRLRLSSIACEISLADIYETSISHGLRLLDDRGVAGVRDHDELHAV